MPRTKQYIEEEVIEKAMELFWKNGYEATSVRMLEKEMGINQFSIYASFKNKQGVFLKSVNCYKRKAKKELIDKLNTSKNGKESIKQYFYDFLDFSKSNNLRKGCLLTNTANELGENGDKVIIDEIMAFASNIHTLFVEKLKSETKDVETIDKQANYLMVALQGLSAASKMFNKNQLEDFIEMTFKNI